MTDTHEIVKWLRKAADEMRADGQNGWPVTCDAAADTIEQMEREWDEAAVERGFEFAVRWAWRDSPASDTERLSAIKYHPDVKARAEALGYPAASCPPNRPVP